MDLYTLDKNFRKTAYIEAYNSVIWSLRYAEYGDFEIHTPYFSELTSYLMSAAYVYDKTTETAMFVEDVEIDSTVEDGSMVIFKGRSLESILTRRIIWRKKTVSGKIQDIIQGLLNENIINPTEIDRQIPNFIFQGNADERLNDCVIDEHSPIELHGDILYDIVKYLCDLCDVGFKVTLNSNNQFVFQLYCGKLLDGSDDDGKGRVVLFSPKMDNLSSTRYYQSSQNYKNITRIESTYELLAEQDKDDPDYEAEQTNSSTSAVIADVASGVSFSLVEGIVVAVKFHQTISAGATLNIASTGALPLYYKGSAIAADVIKSGTKKVTYQLVNGNGRWVVENSAYYVTAHTPTWVVFPRGSEPLTMPLRIAVKFNKKVEAGATLDINDTGPRPLFYNRAPIGEDYIDGSATLIVSYNDYNGGQWVLESLTESEEEEREAIYQSRVLVLPEQDRPIGIDRREIFTDAGNIETETGMTPEDYANSMRLQGYTTLRENRQETEVDGESIPDVSYIYGQDYTLGDIVKVENECGIKISSRIIEYVQTDDENGPSACPTFSSVYS